MHIDIFPVGKITAYYCIYYYHLYMYMCFGLPVPVRPWTASEPPKTSSDIKIAPDAATLTLHAFN